MQRSDRRLQKSIALGGVFAQRGHSANYCVAYPGNTPENHPPTEACMINSKQHGVRNSGPWNLWQASDKKKRWCTSRGFRVQNSRLWDPWLPVVENLRLFAQRGHSAGTAHGAPPYSTGTADWPRSEPICSCGCGSGSSTESLTSLVDLPHCRTISAAPRSPSLPFCRTKSLSRRSSGGLREDSWG